MAVISHMLAAMHFARAALASAKQPRLARSASESSRRNCSLKQLDLLDTCQSDADCVRAASGRCQKKIGTTFCLYDHCHVDADCGPDERCQCPTAEADPVCAVLSCDVDADCGAGQVCRLDQSISGVDQQRHCSTAADSCASPHDCTTVEADACGFDNVSRRWLCRLLVMVD
jgi:hypothetical protein